MELRDGATNGNGQKCKEREQICNVDEFQTTTKGDMTVAKVWIEQWVAWMDSEKTTTDGARG